MRKTTTIFLMLLAPASLAAQQVAGRTNASGAASVDAAPGAARVQLGANAAADARIDAAMERARAEGVGTAMLESRVAEGSAKGASSARIAAAVEHRLDAMVQARDALDASGAAPSRAMLELGTVAIENGASAEQVGSVAAGFWGNARARALNVLGEMAASGRLGADATAAVRGAIDAPLGVAGSGAGGIGAGLNR